jgi:methylamine---glutamate N-methyltransferase subunit B
MEVIDCGDKTTREINQAIRAAIGAGVSEVRVTHTDARHNLGVAVLDPVRLMFEGSVGYYCGGMIDGPTIEVTGSAGWGLAESMLGGTVIVHDNAGNAAGAAMRGGTVIIRGNASARAGVSMKGGDLVIGGDCGSMAAFMAQKGRLIVCGDAAEGLADSMYAGEVFVGGTIAELGNDAVVSEPSGEELASLSLLLTPHELGPKREWKKIVAGRKLWNFVKTESLWREAL